METLNDRIKQLRKEKGYTQNQLADLLGVTDKAVSKWEVGEANPDISLLVKISEIFGVTIDYLLTGKVEEPAISLDDMDDEKRALFLIKKDDAKNFEKYGYAIPNLLFSQPYYGRTDRKAQKILDAIYENGCVSIFKLCLLKGLENNECKRALQGSGALAVQGDLDKYIRLCVKAGCVDGLKAINLKYFAIANKTSATEPVNFHLRSNPNPPFDGYKTPALSLETLNYIFSYKDLSKEILDYLSEIEFFRDRGNVVYLMTDQVICCLYRNKYFDRLNKAIADMKEYNIYAKGIFDESLSGSWYTGKRMRGGAIYFLNNTHSDDSYLRAMVTPINSAFTLAEQNKDFEWIKKFNEYNKSLNELFPDLKAYSLTDKKIKVMEMEANKDTPLADLLALKHVYWGVLNVKGFIGDDYGIEAKDELAIRKEQIQRVKTLKKFVESSFISPYELLVVLADSKKGKELFQFATDLQYAALENAIIDGDKELIKTIAADLFLPSEKIINEFENAKKYALNVSCTGGTKEEADTATELARKKAISEAQGKANSRYFEEKENKYRGKLNEEMFKSLLNLQIGNIPLGPHYLPLTLDYIQQEKTRACDQLIEWLEDKIEIITNAKALERDYNRITSELSKDYLLSELGKGESDKVVVLICKRLQIILEYKFGYSGDLFTMIDTLIDRTMRLHNCTDDEDNNYRQYQEEDQISTKRIQLLHKLRMKRNNIVHAERKEVEMSESEIRECIDLIELLSK